LYRLRIVANYLASLFVPFVLGPIVTRCYDLVDWRTLNYYYYHYFSLKTLSLHGLQMPCDLPFNLGNTFPWGWPLAWVNLLHQAHWAGYILMAKMITLAILAEIYMQFPILKPLSNRLYNGDCFGFTAVSPLSQTTSLPEMPLG
jgi:hypothetical protein